jgi:hypothetical protein
VVQLLAWALGPTPSSSQQDTVRPEIIPDYPELRMVTGIAEHLCNFLESLGVDLFERLPLDPRCSGIRTAAAVATPPATVSADVPTETGYRSWIGLRLRRILHARSQFHGLTREMYNFLELRRELQPEIVPNNSRTICR